MVNQSDPVYSLKGERVVDIQELAEYALKFFKRKPKPGSEEEQIWVLKNRYPQWIKDMLYQVHDYGKWGPDDYKYEYAVETLDRLSEGSDPEEGRDELEADIYTSDLLQWIASSIHRQYYADEALGMEPKDFVTLLMLAQVREMQEIWDVVVKALNNRLEEIEEGIKEVFEGGSPPGTKDWSPREE